MGVLYHNILTYLIALNFGLEAQNLQTEVLGLTADVSKNLLSGFLVLLFFTFTNWLGDIVLLSVNPSGVDNISDSIIAL